ncbi:MAG: hypothetical protein ABIK86_05990 [candidate division WOR-3 bacterium]
MIPRFARLALVIGLLASGAYAQSNTLIDRLGVQTMTYFKIGTFCPCGTVLKKEFGTRVPIGLEARASTKYGFGAGLSVGVWWATAGKDISTFVPVTLAGYYFRPLLDGAIAPFGGLFLAYNSAQLYFAAGDTFVRARGAGMTGGFMLGVEVPFVDKFNLLADCRFGFGRGAMEFDRPVGEILAGKSNVTLSNTSLNLGISLGFSDICLW